MMTDGEDRLISYFRTLTNDGLVPVRVCFFRSTSYSNIRAILYGSAGFYVNSGLLWTRNTWYDFKVTWNDTAETYSAWIKGGAFTDWTAICTNVSYHVTSIGETDRFGAYCFWYDVSGGSAHNIYFDDIYIGDYRIETMLRESIVDVDGVCVIPHDTSFPADPKHRDLFYNTNDDILYCYNGSDWLVIGPHAAGGTAESFGDDYQTKVNETGVTHSSANWSNAINENFTVINGATYLVIAHCQVKAVGGLEYRIGINETTTQQEYMSNNYFIPLTVSRVVTVSSNTLNVIMRIARSGGESTDEVTMRCARVFLWRVS